MRQPLAWQALSLAMLVACGSGSGGGGNGQGDGDGDGQGDESESPDDALAHLSDDYVRYLRGVCQKLTECGGVSDGSSAAQCVAELGSFVCTPAYATVALPEVDACIEAVTCEVLTGGQLFAGPGAPAACIATQERLLEAVGVRVAKSGEGCGLLTLCSDGDYCDAAALSCGSCRPEQAVGARCGSDRECASGLCRAEQCVAPAELGAPCAEDADCASDECGDGACTTRTAFLGRACSDASECGSDQRCSQGKCAELLALGEACERDDDCQLACVDGLCGLLAQCGEGAAGEPCASDDHCADPLRCDFVERRCEQALRDGESCGSLLDCGRDSYCDKAQASDALGKCAPQKALSAPCRAASECQSQFCSDEGLCGSLSSCN
jgi:hypothetical protein